MRKLLFLTFLTIALISCEKEETPMTAPTSNQNIPIDTSGGESLIAKGVTVSKTVSMGADYAQQIWFDLGTNSIVKTNLRSDWDLAFDCRIGNYNLYLNSTLGASVAFTNETDFSKVNSDAGLNYAHEHHSGNEALLAIGDVSQQSNVFIINRGVSPSNKTLGKWKVQITLVQDEEFYMTCSKLNGDNLQTAIISKKPQYNRVAYSFASQSELQIEPPKSDYDLVFTQYTHLFENPPMAYSVNGVLINSYNTEVAEEFSVSYENITNSYAQSLFYSRDLDVIGYDWKNFSLNDNTYTIYSNQNYLIKDASGNLFKLHFIDFYDESGIKGSPSFEFERM